MKYAWNNAIAAVGFMTQDPDVKGPLQGKGYTVKRNPKKKGKHQFVIILTEGDYATEEDEG